MPEGIKRNVLGKGKNFLMVLFGSRKNIFETDNS